MAFLISHPAHFFGLGLGSGLTGFAPGTFGTLAAIPLWLLMAEQLLLIQCVIIIVASVIGIYFCGKTASDLGSHDHGAIVWDEFVGFWLTMLFAPAGLIWLLAGFGLFRLFDIVKPWPIKLLDQKVHGGFGIMIDDVLAGLFAGL
ncbi:MAG TPA: phosphatidylglycerophosphatase A, partial [Cellvibrionales bacterium]|nr:phosphatidylglycerophosphatase A [Cellvibrionales bacterium]